ncbi:hypothetical protein HK405_014772, partial [Cladochytrium tenue]
MLVRQHRSELGDGDDEAAAIAAALVAAADDATQDASPDQVASHAAAAATGRSVATGLGLALLAANLAFLPFVLGSLRPRAIPFVGTPRTRTDAIFDALKALVEADKARTPTPPPALGSMAGSTQAAAAVVTTGARRDWRFIDLGSGDGRVVFAAAGLPNSYPYAFARCVGVEVNSVLFGYSWLRSKLLRQPPGRRVEFTKQDMWRLNVRDFNVAMVFGNYGLMDYFGKKFSEELGTGADAPPGPRFVISNTFPIPTWTPSVAKDGFFIY